MKCDHGKDCGEEHCWDCAALFGENVKLRLVEGKPQGPPPVQTSQSTTNILY